MRYIIGVDGGGTKTLALAENLEGHRQGRGVAGPSNPHAVGFEAACAAIETAIAQAAGPALAQVSAICLGLAGAGRPGDVERFTNWARQTYPGAAIRVVSDAEIVLAAGAPRGAALALICGTGSVAYGRTDQGELMRAGGWGYLFGDEGSGFSIGAAALRAMMQAHDGRRPTTALTSLIATHLGLETPEQSVERIYGSQSPRAEIAALAPLVEKAASQDDAAALSILDEAAAELARMLASLYHRLGNAPLPLALSGGTILHGQCLRQALLRHCAAQDLQLTSIVEVPEPACGALALASQLLLPLPNKE